MLPYARTRPSIHVNYAAALLRMMESVNRMEAMEEAGDPEKVAHSLNVIDAERQGLLS